MLLTVISHDVLSAWNTIYLELMCCWFGLLFVVFALFKLSTVRTDLVFNIYLILRHRVLTERVVPNSNVVLTQYALLAFGWLDVSSWMYLLYRLLPPVLFAGLLHDAEITLALFSVPFLVGFSWSSWITSKPVFPFSLCSLGDCFCCRTPKRNTLTS